MRHLGAISVERRAAAGNQKYAFSGVTIHVRRVWRKGAGKRSLESALLSAHKTVTGIFLSFLSFQAPYSNK